MKVKGTAIAVWKRYFHPWTISRPESEKHGNLCRVSASVCGAPIWFESTERELVPAPEAWAGAMLIPALHKREFLKIESSLDRRWLDNLKELIPIFAEWWRYPKTSPIRARTRTGSRDQGSNCGLMFTCGVDSFHSLLTYQGQIDALIYVHGFDVPLDDTSRSRMVESQIRRVAADCGHDVSFIRSNLREHFCFREVSWGRTHGAALAAIGHILSNDFGCMLLSPSLDTQTPYPWGSDHRTDPLWSTGQLQIKHLATAKTRLDRLLEIADSPLVQSHLRVCWKNCGDDLNCSNCEKCLRTMTALEIAGVLSHCQTFREQVQLAERISNLPPLKLDGFEINHWSDMWNHGLERPLHQAVRHLLERSSYFEAGSLSNAA